MEKLTLSGIILLIVGSIFYILTSFNIFSTLGFLSLQEILGEIGYYIFFVGIIVFIIHFILRFSELYKINKKNYDRNCSKCGREIPTDECICPYCWKDFEEKYDK